MSDFYGINCLGKLHVERVISLPAWSANDKGRIVYDNQTSGLYFGTSSGWSFGPTLTDIVTDIKYRLVVNNGNLQLQELEII